MRSGFVVMSLRLGVVELAAHVSLREEDVCVCASKMERLLAWWRWGRWTQSNGVVSVTLPRYFARSI